MGLVLGVGASGACLDRGPSGIEQREGAETVRGQTGEPTPDRRAGLLPQQRGPDSARSRAAVWRMLLPWGQGPAQVARRPAAEEFPGDGPAAVALGPDGVVYVLDRLNRRVLGADAGGVRVVATVPEHAEDLAFEGGVIAAYSPLLSRVYLQRPADRGGRSTPLGQVAVPRALRGVVGVSVGASRQVWVRTAHQERYRVGSPHAPLSLPATLHSRREGGWRLDAARGLAVRRRPDGRPELLVIAARRAHAPVLARRVLARRVLAARLVGLVRPEPGGRRAEPVACLRLDLPGPGHGPRIDVVRRLVCLTVDSGRTVFEAPLALPPRGYPLLRREVAVATDGERLWVAHGVAETDGLRLTRYAVALGEGGVR